MPPAHAQSVLAGDLLPDLDDLTGVGLLVALPLLASFLAVAAHNLDSKPGDTGVLVTEAIGTYLVVLCVLKAPGSAGLVYVAMIYLGAHTSHAHYNPAITLAHYLAGTASQESFFRYAAAQTGGALLAGATAISQGDTTMPSIDGGATPLTIIFAEALVSFAIILVHLNALGGEIKKGRKGNEHYGLSVGFTFLAGFATVKSISGGLFNPAAGLGLWVAKGITGSGFGFGSTLYYILSPAVGAVFANWAYQYQKAGKAKMTSLAA